jgi:hypothetical protein
MPTCRHCSQAFEITDQDKDFLAKVSPKIGGKTHAIPPPVLCPDCRFQSRMGFRNEWNLYHGKCDLTQKQIISLYAPGGPYTVYDQDAWWSDRYDPLAYGRDYDFSKTFFEQFDALHRRVPKSAIHNAKSENCAYTNYSAENRNCYMLVGGLGAEDCFFSYRIFYSRDCTDCYDLIGCERCYECTESNKLHSCTFCQSCQNCSGLHWCHSCSGCQDCFGCANLRGKRHYIYNMPFSEKEYRAKMKVIRELSPAVVKLDIEKLWLSVPRRYAQITQCEECTGDQLLECQRCTDCYTLKQSQDCRFLATAAGDKDCQDINFGDNCELQYYSANLEKNYQVIFSSLLWYARDCAYSANCFNSHHLFGCSGMKKHAYCILNKQYTEEEYGAIVPKIIDHMRKTEEWGRYFPMHLSPFGYNETVAFDFAPLTEAEVMEHGWKWYREEKEAESYLGPPIEIPATIDEVEDDICAKILTCAISGKPYKIIPQELKFYRDMHLPLPRKCPRQRHKDRMARLCPRELWNRACAKCKKPIATSYAPERPETVYCEECYLATVY